jgi:transcription initiation factor TFIIIB Brf1 subunit/transcription initiation factor TFIIB
MPILLAEIAESIDQREMYPVRRPTLEEETSLKHILGHPPSKLMQALEAIKQTHAAEVSEAVAFREAAAAAEHQEAAAEAAAAAATAAKSDNLVIFEEIFKYVKQNGRLPWTANDVGQVCAQILASHGRNISPESVNEVLQKIAAHLGLKQPVKGKIDQVLKAHKTLNEAAYASARESAEEILKK